MNSTTASSRLLIPLTIATFVVGTDTFIIAGLLSNISKDLGVPPTSAAQLVTVFSAVFAISAPVLGALTAGWRRDTTLTFGLAVFIVGNILTAIAPTFAVALLSRIVAAAGASFITPSASAITIATIPKERQGRALALVMGGLTTATAIGVPLGLVIGALNWRYTLWSLVVLGTISLVLIRSKVQPVMLPAASLKDRLRPLSNLRILAVVATTILVVGASMQLFTYAQIVSGASGKLLIVSLALFGVFNLIGNFTAGKIIDVRGPLICVLICIIGLIGSLATAEFGFAAHLTPLVLAINGFFVGMFTVPQQARIVKLDPNSAPLLLGLLSSAVYVGFAVASSVGKFIIDGIGEQYVGWLAATLLVIPLVLTLTGRKA
ncbi:MFS transporter [Actinomyces slackii]|uniref:Purine efflux pump PbuE n=1 Tax=Actinomyces slackii TaxID=52774 RepID=A0A3S4WLV2_9ACTO|nr:MFS transporter [Actinomyces slackii]VEG75786.1 Purine efflux pump PbuE [Actinomyces slackii]